MLPRLAFGTYKVGVVPTSATEGLASDAAPLRTTQAVVRDALDAGYRCFDCAQFYANEAAVGDALHASGVARESIFLIGKVWNDAIFSGPEAVKAQVHLTLHELRIDFIDLFLVHWPVPGKYTAAYAALLELQADGLIRSVGVSNFTVDDVDVLISATKQAPSVNQIEVNPFLYRGADIAALAARGVAVQAYRTLGTGTRSALGHPLVAELAAKHACSAAQILGRWSAQHGFASVVKSESRARMVENTHVFAAPPGRQAGARAEIVSISDTDMRRLDGLTTCSALVEHAARHATGVVRDTPIGALAAIAAELARRKFAIVRSAQITELLRAVGGAAATEERSVAQMARFWNGAEPQRAAVAAEASEAPSTLRYVRGDEVYPDKATLTSYFQCDVGVERADSTGAVRRSARNNWRCIDDGDGPQFVVEHIDETTARDGGAARSQVRVHKSWPDASDANATLRALRRLLFELIALPSDVRWGALAIEGLDMNSSAWSVVHFFCLLGVLLFAHLCSFVCSSLL
jgi:diketogulonate reductase-like aldo/keto reductase